MRNSWFAKIFKNEESITETDPNINNKSSADFLTNESLQKTDDRSTNAAVADPPEDEMLQTTTKGWWDAIDQMVEFADRMVIPAGPEEARMIDNINNRLKAEKYQLPVLPATLIQVIDHANQPEPNFKAIAELIRGDAVVAGEVMSLVNSAAYASPTPIKDLQRAIIHVGSRRIRSLALAVAARLTVFRNADQRRAEKLWMHSLATAILARAIARASSAEPEEAFLAGLMHDVGKTVVLGLVAEEERANPKHPIPDALLEKLFDECHTGTGAAIARSWSLPTQLAEAIEQHHSLRPFSPPLVATTALANDVCGFLGIGVPARKANLGRHAAFGILGLDRERSQRLLQLLPSVLSEAPEFKGVVKLSMQKGDAGAP